MGNLKYECTDKIGHLAYIFVYINMIGVAFYGCHILIERPAYA